MLRSLIALLAAMLVSVASAEVRTIQHQGLDRLYRLHNAKGDMPAPLVVHLHGYRKREQAVETRDTLDRVAWERLELAGTNHGFVVASLAAYWGRWSMFPGLREATLPDGEAIDDVGYIHAVVAELIRAGVADPTRIYLSGISDGAIMSYRLLCHPASPFTAAVPIVGTMYGGHIEDCRPPRPAAIMPIAGTNDTILPYDGWLFSLGREASIPETMEHWRLLHGCTGQKSELTPDRDADDASRVRIVEWTGCAKDGAVKLLRVEGGGHAVPSFTPVSEEWREKGGGHNRDIESAEEVWKFVSRFSAEP